LATLLSSDLISLVLRVAVGAALTAHGLPKAREGWGKKAGEWVAGMGITPAAARLVTILELFGGLFLIVGFLVPLVGALFAVQFAAIIAVKRGKMKAGFMRTGAGPGYEIDFTYFFLSFAILLLGAGAFSADGLLGIP
jgi:putative oxidoreductase